MFEYDRVWDTTDDLEHVNELAGQGWRVIAAFPDAGRGTMFIVEREVAILEVPLHVESSSWAVDAHDGAPA